MPFFLVTQTSLVEAQDEQEAAQTGVDGLRSGGQVTVAVKSDETTITHVVVAAKVEQPLPVLPSEAINASASAVAIPETASAVPESRKVILKRILADGLALLGRRK
ncbi:MULTISPECIES: hypothetical protein [Rhizobium/Agrobacterium group]|uniref:hypothetical protein n=1 Tax=Rhizobium/Agrobacterium group TaxID=227290 RepID=UPI00056E8456|nr:MULTISPECIES: hypothetical protein [Rhizobium/Agrobacterium group]AKC10655.1 hypothetical protein Ach5_48920 [Agrobacterium tumefaciens]AYM20038.1 hypothetical protein At15955_50530 [Agrobacterium tumefaciens]AYM71341.1 hypothetical protein AtA6_51250 [Agrobacterium tumefaciens]NIB58498.1 hypothetical protein [Agrobacterium tumefaciens]NSZ25155.1 hypothetical protein [Agrobacterium tumefaciens]